MPDYRHKSQLIKDGKMIAEVKKINLAQYADYALTEYGQLIKTDYDVNTAIEKRFELANNPDFIEANRIVDATGKRTRRLRSRIESILAENKHCTFLTLTFTDDCFSKTSVLTRRRYVTRFLKEQSKGGDYVANIDFGALRGREHYHAVCGFRVKPVAWSYGNLDVKTIYRNSKPIKLAKYVSKLTNHAIKETCKRNAIIYSRTGSVSNDQ